MFNNHYVTVLIAAAGMGSRMGLPVNKQFLSIKGKSILSMTLEKFEQSDYVDDIILLFKERDSKYVNEILLETPCKKPYRLIVGGKERQDSIYNGLLNLPERTEIVLTHDGARPFISLDNIKAVIEGVEKTGASVLANRVKDTIKVSSNGITVDYTPNREELWAVQTPQVFFKNILIKAYLQAFDEGYYGTDDCSLVEKTGVKVQMIPGEYTNIKITTPEDLVLAESITSDYQGILKKYGYGED